ncbi:hypothetical protein PM3016_4299 [Paenibacillus mucilaginosus 3016]|uniref:Glycosyltransferase n=1 Tax=Paenibacillus mucilaginosus 3016 TaxID=1116391 RepID=H6NNZ7_9BACL|nr:hypothetical protein [Paenibacillus mucilaginosus]AFC31071.1 hypothetical protein PM3016_4299 [Paenibacillus mucilaginosus 3016]
MNKTRLQPIGLLCVSLALAVLPLQGQAAAQEQVRLERPVPGQSKMQLAAAMRKLWMEHVIWTRNYIVSAVDGLADQDQVLARLLKNQQDIGDAIKPFYGEAAGHKLAELLREHIVIAGKIVGAAKQGDQAQVQQYNKEWYRNADDIAEFLSRANPHWPKKEVLAMLHRHLELVADALRARLQKDWEADIRAFDQGEEHILMLADTLSQGIQKQFPKKFR